MACCYIQTLLLAISALFSISNSWNILMWALLIPLLAQLGGKLGDFFKQRNDIQQQRIANELAIEQAKQQMAMEVARAQLELNKTIVDATGSYFKYFTFFMWFGPFIIGVIKPSMAHDIFSNLAGMPEWYVQSCMLIMFTVWGISVSAPVVSNIFSGLQTFLADKREYKLEKAKIDRKLFFEAMRKLKGTLTQQDVDEQNKVLDEAEGKQG